MCQDNNDQSRISANTGIGNISTADSTLTGGGAISIFLAKGPNGSMIKSIIIKAAQATLEGMVRIYIKKSGGLALTLYKEVCIPVVPQSACQPVPTPQYIMYETILIGNFFLEAGDEIWAATQNAQSFNIFVEGLDVSYPLIAPSVCCNLAQNIANTGLGIVSVGNPNLDGVTGAYTTIFTGGSPNGSLIKTITIKALQSTHEGAVRFFVSPDGGSTWFLMQEVWIPQTTQSAYEPSYKQVIAANYRLQDQYIIKASTQNSESFAITVEAENWIYPLSN